MTSDRFPIACIPSRLTQDERLRKAELLREQLASVVEVRERGDGYSFGFDADPARFVRLAEFVSLEHRCCPFLHFDLEWSGGDARPWLHITGGARVKPFIAETFVTAPGTRETP